MEEKKETDGLRISYSPLDVERRDVEEEWHNDRRNGIVKSNGNTLDGLFIHYYISIYIDGIKKSAGP